MGLKIGVAGLGRVGAFHLDTLLAASAVGEVFVTDVVPEAIGSATGRYAGVTGCADVDAVLAAGVDGLVIASPAAGRVMPIERSVAAGVPVFCEPPIAMSSAESAAVRARCAAAGVPVVVGRHRGFDRAAPAAPPAVSVGDLGFAPAPRSTPRAPAPPPMSSVAGSGGIFRDFAVHDFDTLCWVVGGDVVEVYATGGNQGDPGFTANDDVDSATAILTFASGAMGVVSVSRYNGRGHDCRLEVHGSTDSVVAGWDHRTPVRNLDPRCAFPSGTPHGSDLDRFARARRRELGEFCALIGGEPPSWQSPFAHSPLCSVEEAHEVALIADAATTSLHEKRPVRIDEIAAI